MTGVTGTGHGKARALAGLGAALGVVATAGALLARQSGRLETVSPRFLAGTAVPPLLAILGLSLYDRWPRLSGALVMAAAGWMAGNVIAASGGIGLLWVPAALLLVQGAYTLLKGARPR